MDLFKVYENILALKNLKRKGWQLKNIAKVESVADHSYAVSVLAMIIASELRFDVEKCVKMALIHDLTESRTQDITPHDDITEKEKYDVEKKVAKEIAKSTEIKDFPKLLEEYHKCESKEAKLVKDLDKIEMLLQALKYEEKYGKDLTEFFEYVKPKLHLENSKKLFEEISRKRVKK